MNSELVLFAIEAGVRLGRKVEEVLIDETVERPLLLPVGDLYADVDFNRAREFFDRLENQHLESPDGPYHGFSQSELVLAYKTIRSINERQQPGATAGDGTEIVANLHRFNQYREGFGADSPVKRIVGTLAEIGIDYFTTHPEAMGGDSVARRIVHAFIQELQETDFAEGGRREIVGRLLSAALRTLDANITLIDDDEQTRALLGGMTEGLIEVMDGIATLSGKIVLEDLIARAGSGLLSGAAAAFTEHVGLFIRNDGVSKTLVKSTLVQILRGIKGKEDLFTNESLELIFASALTAVAENAEVFSSKPFVQELIAKTLASLRSTHGRKLFAPEMTSAVIYAALEVVRDNVETLFDENNPQEQLLADVLGALARSLTGNLASGGTARNLLSKRQLMELVEVVFATVAMNPEKLIGAEAGNQQKMAIAQIIGSVASALGENPARLVNGEGFVGLVKKALRVAVANADKLIDVDSTSTKKNLIFKILRQIVVVVDDGVDVRKLVSRNVFRDIAERVLVITSANIELILEGQDRLVEKTIRTALELANGVLQNRVNGDNLPCLIEELLRAVLWDELNLDEMTAVERAAIVALREAA